MNRSQLHGLRFYRIGASGVFVQTQLDPLNLVKEDIMLRWALIFFVIALVAALFGFGGVAGASAGIAKILFFIFLVVFVLSLIMHLARRA